MKKPLKSMTRAEFEEAFSNVRAEWRDAQGWGPLTTSNGPAHARRSQILRAKGRYIAYCKEDRRRNANA